MPKKADNQQGTRQRTIKLILLVEDEVEIAQLIIGAIEQETPHHIHHHITGRDALQAISIHTPHLFILNYNLPDMNGLHLHDQLHRFDHLKDTPTLLLSAESPPLEEVRQRRIIFLAKPFDLRKLLDTITMLLAKVA